MNNAKNIGLTVFHDCALPPDDFVANCTIPFEDLAHRAKEQQDFWVNTLHIFHYNKKKTKIHDEMNKTFIKIGSEYRLINVKYYNWRRCYSHLIIITVYRKTSTMYAYRFV